MTEPAFLALPDGRRIAHRFTDGPGPVLVFLPGYMSDMAGSKATFLFDHAAARGQPCLLLDYSGCGQSSGLFADGSLTRWRDEVLALLAAVCPARELILAGSSMGGWLMLLLAEALGNRVNALVGIAPAPDFTDWGFDDAQKALLVTGETLYEENPYGPEPTPTHPLFWADGQENRLLHRPVDVACPVRILQGQHDLDVPWDTALSLATALRSADVQVTLIKDGDHRLSRDPDLALLLRTVDGLRDSATGAD
ncbi:alpha/beta hydrolase [Novosphingobium flavum]|uniref:Palmitoyl-protein thioesterase ABHD10, mitochondrial n=1 Tax=Novosphingobium flavum TaxID=1778672 RepID=A0A7X1FP72_9SPHN|nr:alpha/beta hydrolase [Novosphingobium flavum]MBC2664474.1 alpha/beta hydrolase [Novosphingobium flavum]